MAGFCVLCGEKLPFFGAKSLVCANSDESFCSKCHDTLYHMNNRERGEYLLEHGSPKHPDKMREFLVFIAAKEEERKACQPEQRPCPACGGTMDLKLKQFRIGADGGGGLATLLADQYEVDLYACSECGKVELYTANFAAIKARQARQEAEQAARTAQREQEIAAKQREYTSYSSGRKPGEKPPWEK